jgi:glycosyltransferase involved in cell wall biosynthesis
LKSVLLIAYYYEPFKGVGSKRMSYWGNAFFANPEYNCKVVTATPQNNAAPGVYFVEDNGKSFMNRFFQGYSWIQSLKEFLESNKQINFDYVIISGGPFGHFGITKYLKQKRKCKVVLDFRDPFSRNSRFKTFFLKDYVKVLFEKFFLMYADHIVTVNEYCRDLLLSSASPGKVSIIENGYDERAFDRVNTGKFDRNGIHIVYAGSFYADRDPSSFIKTMISSSTRDKAYYFHHIGSSSDFLAPFRETNNIIEHGEKSYAETIQIMKACDVGLLVTSGEPMESTTKIYDYIGCDLDVLVVTSGKPHSGSIEKITKKISSKAHWVRNEPGEINTFLLRYSVSGTPIANKLAFSRKYGFDQLTDLINHI